MEFNNFDLEREYGLHNVIDKDTLEKKVEKTISDGIFYSADQNNKYKLEKYEEIKEAIPEFEEFKSIYLQLRLKGLDGKLFENIDYNTVNYGALLQKAKEIIEEKDKNEKQKIDEVIKKQELNSNNIYKINEIENVNENNSLTVVKEEKFYKKIWNNVCKFFTNNK